LTPVARPLRRGGPVVGDTLLTLARVADTVAREAIMKLIPTALALVVVALFGVALLSMAAGDTAVAGVSFLSASLVIYLRAKWLQRDRSGV